MSSSPLDTVVPVHRRSLHDELVGRIRDMIIEGQLVPGTRIHEGRIGAALGVSRTPLREALKYVASEGLIELVQGRGAVVRKLSRHDVRGMLDVLIALEVLAARLACRQASDGGIASVRSLHEEMMRFYAEGNRLEYYKRNQAIHSGIVALSGNECLSETHEGIQLRLKRIRFIGNGERAKWDGAVAEHQAMIQALEARNEDHLANVITEHLEQTWHRVEGSI